MSYLDVHRQVSKDIDAEIAAALERLGPPSSAARKAVATLLQHRKLRHPLSVLPLLVHAVETGTPGPAIPVSAIHLLWWTSACYFDDLADGHGAAVSGGLSENEALLASVVVGNVLPLQIIQSPQVPETVRGALITEVLNSWTLALTGQIDDMRGDVGSATRNSVIATYRGKSGAPFGMITTLAATLAGAASGRTELWREFGYVFGILWQMFNDQEDIVSGRNEDLLNGTVTYLLVCAVEESSTRSREHILNLCAAAGSSHPARTELAGLLRAPAVLRRYREDLDGFRDEAHRILGELGGDEAYLPALRQLVDQSARMLLEADLVPAGATTAPRGSL
ncbi:polyprenyl synthetase family protein [Streptomyces sp. NPDC003038]|uniref:polyprenyl synthetase family protein n=1 Tax=unclassified Streptomyces TaxID=2593676 RepID=UPI0033A91688